MRKSFTIALAAALALALGACKPPPAKEYVYPAWGFAISFWSPPKVTEFPANAQELHHLTVESDTAGRQFAAFAGDGIKPDTSIDDIGRDAADVMAKQMGGEVDSASYASTAAGVTGREYKITKNGKPFATIRAFVANSHFYEVGAQSLLGPDDPAVKDFLDSFRIIPGPGASAADNAPAHDNAVNDALARQAAGAPGPAPVHDDAVEQALARQRAATNAP
jgi:hypothetical protein